MGSGRSTVFDDVVNVASQIVSGGLVGYEEGKFGRGATTRAADETLGEISGRNLAREADHQNKMDIAREEAKRNQERIDKLKKQEEDERQASRMQQLNIDSAARRAQGANRLGSTMADADFLGL